MRDVYLQGEFGVDGLFVGVPVVLGRDGLERVFEIELTPDERVAFDESVDGRPGAGRQAPGLNARLRPAVGLARCRRGPRDDPSRRVPCTA